MSLRNWLIAAICFICFVMVIQQYTIFIPEAAQREADARAEQYARDAREAEAQAKRDGDWLAMHPGFALEDRAAEAQAQEQAEASKHNSVGDQANAIKARCGLGKDEHGNYEVWPEDSARAMRCLKANTHWNPFWIPGDG